MEFHDRQNKKSLLKFEGEYFNDWRDGMGVEYYKNGKIKCIGNFKKGLYEGWMKMHNRNGELIYEG